MMQILLCRQDGELGQQIEASELSEVISDPGNLVWVDLYRPTQ